MYQSWIWIIRFSPASSFDVSTQSRASRRHASFLYQGRLVYGSAVAPDTFFGHRATSAGRSQKHLKGSAKSWPKGVDCLWLQPRLPHPAVSRHKVDRLAVSVVRSFDCRARVCKGRAPCNPNSPTAWLGVGTRLSGRCTVVQQGVGGRLHPGLK